MCFISDKFYLCVPFILWYDKGTLEQFIGCQHIYLVALLFFLIFFLFTLFKYVQTFHRKEIYTKKSKEQLVCSYFSVIVYKKTVHSEESNARGQATSGRPRWVVASFLGLCAPDV